MWISSRGQYGLRALVELAAQENQTMPINAIATAQGISQGYLEQIFASLRRAGLIRSSRGATGGYKLLKAASQINALDVILILEGDISPVACVSDPSSCTHLHSCGTQSLWEKVDLAVRRTLASSTIADLLEEARFQSALKDIKAQKKYLAISSSIYCKKMTQV